jgi:hypothetical protein
VAALVGVLSKESLVAEGVVTTEESIVAETFMATPNENAEEEA